MANLFKNPLVVAETVVGSMTDLRNVVLYAQPENIDTLPYNFSVSHSDGTTTVYSNTRSIQGLVKHSELVELFTGIYTPYLSQINGYNMFGVSYMSADINISSDLCDHPVENGEVVTDNAILNPLSAKIIISMPTALYTRIYKEIEDYYTAKKYILVQTKFGLHRNFVITAMPYRLDVGSVDRAQIELSLRQVMVVEPRYVAAEVQMEIPTPAVAENKGTEEVGYLSPNVVESLGVFDVTNTN